MKDRTTIFDDVFLRKGKGKMPRGDGIVPYRIGFATGRGLGQGRGSR